MSAASHRGLISYRELLALFIAADGWETLVVTLPTPVVSYMASSCHRFGQTRDDWILQAVLERVERDGDMAQWALQQRRRPEQRSNVHRDADITSSPIIDEIDRIVKDRIAAAYAASDHLEVDRIGMRHVAFKQQIENLSAGECAIVAVRMLRELCERGDDHSTAKAPRASGRPR